MAELKNKSEINIGAAQLLFDKHYFPSVPHPAYYSCLQLMKHIICKKIYKDYDIQEAEIAIHGIGSHMYYINTIAEEIESKQNKRQASEFTRKIKELKALREKADYANTSINFEQARGTIQRAQETIETLQNIFR
ncbi:MAG: hypothetical protein RBR62_01975 [Bacteroidales bacterium]|jgi:uncharacterized protein (UPF0332 family)|nr:hypothetical protein [Bacteroidales bacterium]